MENCFYQFYYKDVPIDYNLKYTKQPSLALKFVFDAQVERDICFKIMPRNVIIGFRPVFK